MRIHRLEIEGFGPFRDIQVVDFDAFAGDGIFLIGGKTGAGKSSILDAVCFALYGGVPRYEDGEKRLRSDHSSLDEPTRVRLEFSSGDRRWRIERVPTYERRKRSGHGTTQSPAEERASAAARNSLPCCMDDLVRLRRWGGDTASRLMAGSLVLANQVPPTARGWFFWRA